MPKDGIDDAILKLRIVVSALILGVASFGAIVYLLVRGKGFEPDSSLQVPLLGALGALIIGLLSAYPVVRKAFLDKTDVSSADPADLVPAYSALVVIRSAMIEGIGLFGGVIYLLTAHPLGLLAILCSIALLLARLPSRREINELAARAREEP